MKKKCFFFIFFYCLIIAAQTTMAQNVNPAACCTYHQQCYGDPYPACCNCAHYKYPNSATERYYSYQTCMSNWNDNTGIASKMRKTSYYSCALCATNCGKDCEDKSCTGNYGHNNPLRSLHVPHKGK